MSPSKKHFQDFSKMIRETLELEFSVQEVKDSIWLIRFENFPLQLYFYGLGSEGRIGHAIGSGPLIPAEIKTIHLDEDLWVNKPGGLLARLRAQVGQARKVHARDTVVSRIDKKLGMQFQAEHHLHVPLPGKFRFGLFLKGELVSIAVFSGGRKMREQAPEYRSYELLRTCHKSGLIVVGGLSKLIRHFEEQFRPDDLMTYVDRDWSDGQNYLKLGFRLAGELPPQEFWVDLHTMQCYTSFDLPPGIASMDPDMRQAGGCYRIFNTGSLKLVKKNIIPKFG